MGDPPAGGAPELFWAWRTFFERLSADGVVALLFEDLQWADAGTLDFIEHMVEWSRNVPILIVTLARPDLLDRRPGWGAGKRAFLALDLQPLDEGSMRELLAGLVPGLPEATVRAIVGRAEGIPLYAVETIRMLIADGRLVEDAAGTYEPAGELGELAVPNTLHALIAARLDGLDAADRALLQDGAVLGQSFRADALADVCGIPVEALLPRLDKLARADLLRVEMDPRSPERGQYAFVQALIREVAYSTLSLRDRRSRHLAAARHFEALPDEDTVGALAAHYLAAYKASADGPEGEALAAQARIALKAAADRASALGSMEQAVQFLEQAIEVAGSEPERAELQERAGIAATLAARHPVALAHLEAAITIRRELGDRSGVARLSGWVGATLSLARRRDESLASLRAAFAEFEDLGDGDPDLVFLMRHLSANLALVGDLDDARAIASRQLAAAERLSLAELAAEALHTKGMVAFREGRTWEGRALVQGALDLFREAGLPNGVLRAMQFLATMTALDNPAQTLVLEKDSIALARRLGNRPLEVLTITNSSEDARRSGDWDWAIGELDGLFGLDLDHGTHLQVEVARNYFRQAQGDLAPGGLEALEAAMAELSDPELAASVIDMRAIAALLEARWQEAADVTVQAALASEYNAPYLYPKAGRAATCAGDRGIAANALERMEQLAVRGRVTDADRTMIRAGVAALDGDLAAAMAGYRAAAAAYRELGLRWDEALFAIEIARVLGAGDPEREGWIDHGREVLRSLGCRPYLVLLDRVVAEGPLIGAEAPDEA